MPSPPFNAAGRRVLARGVCGGTVHLGNSRPAVSFELTLVTGA